MGYSVRRQSTGSFVLTARLNGVSIPTIGDAQEQGRERDIMRLRVFSRFTLHAILKRREWAIDVSA